VIAHPEPQALDVVRVDQQYSARSEDPSKAIVERIDRRIELVIASQRHQAQYLAPFGIHVGILVEAARLDEVRLFVRRFPFAAGRGHRPAEPAGRPHAFVEVVKDLRIYRLDLAPYLSLAASQRMAP
jgi:hypothetical protein